MEKNKLFFKILFWAFLLLFGFVFFDENVPMAYAMTSAQCTSAKGSCNWFSNSCNSDQDFLGLCEGYVYNSACCRAKQSQQSQQQTQSFLSYTSRSGPTGGLVPCIDNCTLCHLVIGIKNIFEYLIYVVLFPLFTLGIVISGVLYMVSSGNRSLVEKAKTAFTYSLMGAVIALTSWLLVNAVLHALGYKSVGNWWTYTCDTAQTTGPGTLSPDGSTLPPGGSTAKGDGTCGGVAVAQNSDQCNSASKGLEDALTCIKNKVSGASASKENLKFTWVLMNGAQAASTLSVSSLGQNQNGGNWQACVGENWSSANCPHTKYSCHYGGRYCQGQINAVDLTGSNLSEIASAAKECSPSGSVYYGDASHQNHVHVSVNNAACGCDSKQ